MQSASVRRRRLPAAARRQQIIDAVFRVASQHGIRGTTISRVAQSAGVGIGTVYRYFDDQKAMLRSAVEALGERLVGNIPDSYVEDAIEHIRHMAEQHEALVSANDGYVARLWLEFIGANEQLGLRDAVLETQQAAVRAIQEVCERGKAQGSIRDDVDLDLLAYRIMEQAWGVEMSILMGLDVLLGRTCASRVTDALIDSIAGKPRTPIRQSDPETEEGPLANP
jgi:AcrR family transcriptional regulator